MVNMKFPQVVCAWGRAELQAYVKSNTDENLNLNNTISGKKKQLEELEQETYTLEAKKNYALQVASQRTLEYGQVTLVAS